MAERYGYDAYGTSRTMDASWSSISSSLDWEFRFQASYFDSETGLYLMRYRYLHPKLGRWLSRDLVGYAGTDANLYRFVGNNPTCFGDPTGLKKCCEDEAEDVRDLLRDANYSMAGGVASGIGATVATAGWGIGLGIAGFGLGSARAFDKLKQADRKHEKYDTCVSAIKAMSPADQKCKCPNGIASDPGTSKFAPFWYTP
ncbi:MAG: RHS repeat-associated core domain-containing protein [Bryobacteraceae bacterium]